MLDAGHRQLFAQHRQYQRAVFAELNELTRLSLSIALSHAGFTLLAVVDTAIPGRTSPAALEAGALGRNIMFACSALGLGISLSLESIASQAIASSAPDRTWRALVRVLRANLLFAWLAAGAVAVVIATLLPMIPSFNVSPAAADGARLFVLGNLPALLAHSAFAAGRTFLQGYGRVMPMVGATLGANLLNWAVCNVLVGGDEFLIAAHLPGESSPRSRRHPT